MTSVTRASTKFISRSDHPDLTSFLDHGLGKFCSQQFKSKITTFWLLKIDKRPGTREKRLKPLFLKLFKNLTGRVYIENEKLEKFQRTQKHTHTHKLTRRQSEVFDQVEVKVSSTVS